MLLLNECLLLEAYITLRTQSGNFWIQPRIYPVASLKHFESSCSLTPGVVLPVGFNFLMTRIVLNNDKYL